MYQFTSPIISEIIFCDYTVVIEISYASPIWLCKIVNFSINRNLNSESGLAHLAELISSICGVIMFKYRMPPLPPICEMFGKGYICWDKFWSISSTDKFMIMWKSQEEMLSIVRANLVANEDNSTPFLGSIKND